jgi:hypothetical protein
MPDQGYEPPPAFAPPLLRTAPLNESQILGGTTYPNGPYAAWSPPPPSLSAHQPPPPRRPSSPRPRWRTSVLVTAAVVVALLGVGVALGLTGGSDHASRSISLPETVSSYDRSIDYSPQLVGLLGSSALGGAVSPEDIRNAKAGVYRNTSPGLPTGSVVPAVVFFGFNADDSPGIGRRLHNRPPEVVTNEVLLAIGGGAFQITWAAGPLGGSIRCGDVQIYGETASVGIWADYDTLGIVLTIPSAGTAPLDYMGRLTRRMRAAAES